MKKYGLIGFPLTHSFSKKYFAEKFEKEKIEDVSYDLFPLENIDDVRLLFEVEKELCGINVTIPFKESVIQYLDDLAEDVKKIGAVNCIRINEFEKTGFNTDYAGFRDSLIPLLQTHHKHALILGTGGSSKAVSFALQQLGIEHTFVSREKKQQQFIYSELNKNILEAYQILINTSPLGMFPNIQDCPQIPYQHLTKHHLCYDLIYNPDETIFLQKAKQQNALIKSGLEMLQLQAEYSWNIWNADND